MKTLPRVVHDPVQPGADQALFRVEARQLGQLADSMYAPLTAILGSLGQLTGPGQDAGSPLGADPRNATVVQAIRRGAVRQARLLDNLDALGELQLGRVPRRGGRADVAGLLRHLPADLELEVAEAGVLLAVLPDLTAGRPVVAGDTGQLRHAVRELVRNAVAASQPGQTVMVSAGATGSAREPAVTIRIEDCGRGIPAEELPAVLRPFARTRWATEHQQPGVGLGLAVADGVIRAHLGRLELTSLAGQGTRALVRLPAASPSGSTPRP